MNIALYWKKILSDKSIHLFKFLNKIIENEIETETLFMTYKRYKYFTITHVF